MIEGRYSGFRGYIHWQATRRAESNRYSGIVQAGVVNVNCTVQNYPRNGRRGV